MNKTVSGRRALKWLTLPCVCLLLSLGVLGLAKVTGKFDTGRQEICFDINTSTSGATQLFRADSSGDFSEQRSETIPLIPGAQISCFATSIGERFLRWDPNNIASSMRIKNVTINYYGFKQTIKPDLIGGNSYGITQLTPAKSELELVFTNGDPQIVFEVDSAITNKQIIYSALLLAIAMALGFLIAKRFIIKVMIEKSPAYRMASFAIIVLIVVQQATGVIAVGDGAGWDGNAYLDLLFNWKQSGQLPGTDPYRLSRLASLFPIVISEFIFDLPRAQLLNVQVAFNILAIGAALGLFMDYLVKTAVPLQLAKLYTLALLLTWPILVMPTYYPILSDHLAIVLSCYCLWCFAYKRFHWLAIICLLSPLVMPGLFLLPLTLLAFSQSEEETTRINLFSFSNTSKWLVFSLLAVAMSYYACLWFSRITDNELLHIGSTLAAGLPQFRMVSSAYLIGALAVVAWLWSSLLGKNGAFSVFAINRLVVGMIAAVIGHGILYFGLDWDKGFKGPNLLQNMFYQGLNAPFKPIVAHFVYFGPCFILALILLLSTSAPRRARPLKIAVLGFLPLLVIGSESRQWVAILPFLIAYVAQFECSRKQHRLILTCSVLLAAPLFWLGSAVTKAYAMGLPTNDMSWQFYFGHFGPWMSQTTYFVSALALLVFIAAWMLTRRHELLLHKSGGHHRELD